MCDSDIDDLIESLTTMVDVTRHRTELEGVQENSPQLMVNGAWDMIPDLRHFTGFLRSSEMGLGT